MKILSSVNKWVNFLIIIYLSTSRTGHAGLCLRQSILCPRENGDFLSDIRIFFLPHSPTALPKDQNILMLNSSYRLLDYNQLFALFISDPGNTLSLRSFLHNLVFFIVCKLCSLPLRIWRGNSLAVQWLGICAFTAESPSSIPGWGTKIPQAMWQIGRASCRERV